jgi:hypothetical protein
MFRLLRCLCVRVSACQNQIKPPALQDQLVKILKEVLGHHLFVPEAGQLSREGQWLSPEALKHKVVVRMKVKPGRRVLCGFCDRFWT